MKPNVVWQTPAAETASATVTRASRGQRDFLYMYLDESGNLDFKATGSTHFIMTCAVAKRPFSTADELRDTRYDLIEDERDVEKFHACEDSELIRKSVYRVLSSEGCSYRVYSAYVEKGSVPDEFRTPEAIYSGIFSLLLDEIYKDEKVAYLDGVIVITDKLPKDAQRRNVVKPLKKYMKEKFQARHIPYVLAHHESSSDMSLQAADYFCWAIQRKLARGKDWPMKAVEKSFAAIGKVEFK